MFEGQIGSLREAFTITFSSLTCCKLAGFELRGKAYQKIIDSTKQLE